jgi:hypothetical protein
MKIQGSVVYLLMGIAMFGSSAGAEAQCPIDVEVTAARPAYQTGEPIEVIVRFVDRGAAGVRLSYAYPTLSGLGEPGIRFEPTGSLKPAAPAGATDQIAPLMSVPAGGNIKVSVFLQRFLSGFAPGQYTIPWSVRVPCMGPTGHRAGVVQARGDIRFQVAAGSPATLHAVFANYAQELETADTFRQREAVEALQSAESPLVVQYLERLPQLGYRQQAFAALTKFRTDARARQLVLDAVKSSPPQDVLVGLSVLRAWGERLPEPDLKSLLERPDRMIKIATLQFVAATGTSSDVQILQPYVDSPEPDIAGAARQARAALLKR